MTHRVRGFFNLLFLPVQKAEVALPGDGKDAREHESILRGEEPEAERRHRRPQLERIDNANRHRTLDPRDCPHGSFARKHGLHAKEVGVEHGSEDGLVDCDLGNDRGDFGGEIEVSA